MKSSIVYRDGEFFIIQVDDSWPVKYYVYSDNRVAAYNKDAYWHLERAIYKLKNVKAEQFVGKCIKHESCTYRIEHSRTYPSVYDIYVECPERFVHYGKTGERFEDALDWVKKYEQCLKFKVEANKVAVK